MYIEIRDAYYHLYNNEAETLTANPALREMLNRLYDNFTERFGRLNDKRNLDLIKMDARGTEILSLERYIDGKARKADIFEASVAFNPDEITHADDASGGPCGQPEQVRPGGTSLHGIAHGNYRGGNTRGTERTYLLQPGNGRLRGCRQVHRRQCHQESRTDRGVPAGESRPRPGPGIAGGSARGDAQTHRFRRPGLQPGRTVDSKGVYERFASSLFDTEVKITFASNLDEYGVKAEATNVKITEQYAVSAQTRKYNGLHLFETRPAKHFARHHQDRPQMGGRRTAGGQSA